MECRCGGQNNGLPRKVHILIPNLANVNLQSKIDFAVMTKGLEKWADNPGLSGWDQYNHKGPYKREAGGSQ